MTSAPSKSNLLTPGEVASLFGVDPKTVTRWAQTGKLPVIRTIGGHRRFPADAVHALREPGSDMALRTTAVH